jgi:hypothetical protein
LFIPEVWEEINIFVWETVRGVPKEDASFFVIWLLKLGICLILVLKCFSFLLRKHVIWNKAEES